MLHVVVVCLVSSCHTKYTCNIIDEECIDTVFLLGQKYSPAHLFIDKISGYGQIIPSQSLFDIEITHRLGFNTIELNVHQTSDGMFVCIHGENGTFGQQVKHIDDQTDISNMSISSVPLSYIQDKIRYKSTRSEYQTTIPTLEQCCELCSKLGMSVYLALTGVSRDNSINAINICKKWFGNNFVVCAYGDEQAYYLRSIFKGIIMNWTPTIELSEIEEFIKKIGLPYIHCVRRDNYSNETSDITFKNISSTIHNNGGYAGFSAAYTPESLAQRMWNCGFDIAGPSYNINDFEGGNICQLTSEDNFTAFTTTASVVDGSLLLSETDIILILFFRLKTRFWQVVY